jgi:hypothetical protein
MANDPRIKSFTTVIVFIIKTAHFSLALLPVSKYTLCSEYTVQYGKLTVQRRHL